MSKVQAIRVYRDRTGEGLKESKDNIEKAMTFLDWTPGPNDNARPCLFEDVKVPECV